MANDDTQWYYNPASGQVAQGKELAWDERMGPYESEEAARHALETAAQRTQAADAADEADDNWGVPPKWEN
ncbi:hypothetical protein [Corynebacterium epidermidicanis]|uniref:SPOR domain-containing protein n=1 Tax=Corynebacterium epidermidicanis TaxID=1050174 RepID=A0A0G3GR26_9CORY|nr:hypothetical protein [Corynebacterium epidermidicanis]AKK03594.1 hypothetical protein CEPID_08720 [Corynebacterium epidermidicanis]